jgi:DNA-binding CsgD family transcriptional regulator
MTTISNKIIFSKKIENVYRENSIQLLCAPLFSQIKSIIFFDYQRYYDDGRFFTMSTNPTYIKHYYSEGVYINTKEIEQLRRTHGTPKKLYGFYTQEIALTDSLDTEKKHAQNIKLGKTFSIERRFFMMGRKKNYFSITGIGTNKDEGVQSFMQLCLENVHVFNAFIYHFKNEGKQLINAYKNEMLTLPCKLEYKQEDKERQCYDFKTGNKFSLTSREYECLESMTLGRSMKETALILNLSPRTVEVHINNIKLKTGFYTRSQLISFFYRFGG